MFNALPLREKTLMYESFFKGKAGEVSALFAKGALYVQYDGEDATTPAVIAYDRADIPASKDTHETALETGKIPFIRRADVNISPILTFR